MQKPVAIITGASRGIGAATARLLAKQGFDLCLNYKSNDAAANALLKDVSAMGIKAIAVKADIANEDQVRDMFAQVDAQLGPLTALVNNAALMHPQARLEELDAARINTMLSTNVTGYFLCCKYAILRMAHRHGGQGGAIVNVSSAASRIGAPGEYIDYAASKGAIDTLTRGLSLEVAAEGIRVNAVRPGFIYTDMHKDGGEAGRVDRLASAIPMQRGGQPEEVADAISWLLSEHASYSTGSFIELAGGR